jgi:hypothetical protein
MAGGQFSWSNNKAISTMEKLHRLLVNKEWELVFSLATILKLTRESLDHNPIILDTMEDTMLVPTKFRFDKR